MNKRIKKKLGKYDCPCCGCYMIYLNKKSKHRACIKAWGFSKRDGQFGLFMDNKHLDYNKERD